jgi:hypothetical protein
MRLAERGIPVEELLKRMGSAAVPTDADPDDATRERAVAVMNARLEVISEDKRRRRRGTRTLLLSAAAAIVLGVGALALWGPLRAPMPLTARTRVPLVQALEGEVEIVRGGQRVRAATPEPTAFQQADEIHTTAGARASAELESGATVNVEELSLLRLAVASSGAEELGLARGHVEISVPHLRPGATLSVRTPDARVMVRGTRFVVAVALRDARTMTSVSVLEGSVWVETGGQKLVLTRGARWSSGSDAAGEKTSDTSAPSLPVSPQTTATAHAFPTPHEGRSETGSTLAHENELYLDAMSAARDGNDTLAEQRLETLLERYPKSPLAPAARTELERLRKSGKAAP